MPKPALLHFGRKLFVQLTTYRCKRTELARSVGLDCECFTIAVFICPATFCPSLAKTFVDNFPEQGRNVEFFIVTFACHTAPKQSRPHHKRSRPRCRRPVAEARPKDGCHPARRRSASRADAANAWPGCSRLLPESASRLRR